MCNGLCTPRERGGDGEPLRTSTGQHPGTAACTSGTTRLLDCLRSTLPCSRPAIQPASPSAATHCCWWRVATATEGAEAGLRGGQDVCYPGALQCMRGALPSHRVPCDDVCRWRACAMRCGARGAACWPTRRGWAKRCKRSCARRLPLPRSCHSLLSPPRAHPPVAAADPQASACSFCVQLRCGRSERVMALPMAWHGMCVGGGGC